MLHGFGILNEKLASVPNSTIDDSIGYTHSGSQKTLTYSQQIQLALRKMYLGQLGEKIVYQSEINRLTEAHRKTLAQKVEWVSQRQPFLGFDITSFDNHSNQEYVEVKSSVGKLNRFYFTANEMGKAKQYGDRYRVICVSNVEKSPTLLEIRNPLAEIDAGNLRIYNESYLVVIK